MKLIDLIKAQCKLQGVSDKYAERILKLSGITEEKDGNIIAAVKNFKENVMPLIEESSSSAEEAARKAVEEYEKKHGLVGGKAVNQDTPPALPDTLDPAVRAIIENQNKMMETMSKSITDLTAAQKKTSALEVVKAKMKGKVHDNMIDHYAKQVDLDNENLDAEIERVVGVYTEFQQTILNSAVESGNYQPVEGSTSKASDKDIDAYIESKSKSAEEGPFAGIKL